MDRVNVPPAVRPAADQVVAVTDAVCRAHLDMEYADLCRAVICKADRRAARRASVPLQIRAFTPWADSLCPQDGS